MSSPGLEPAADLRDAWAEDAVPAPPRFGKRHIFMALAVFAVVVVTLATWGRDVRSAKAPSSSAATAERGR